MGIAKEWPDYQYFGERSAFRDVDDDPRVLGERDIIFGVKLNGRVAVELKRTERVHKIGQ